MKEGNRVRLPKSYNVDGTIERIVTIGPHGNPLAKPLIYVRVDGSTYDYYPNAISFTAEQLTPIGD